MKLPRWSIVLLLLLHCCCSGKVRPRAKAPICHKSWPAGSTNAISGPGGMRSLGPVALSWGRKASWRPPRALFAAEKTPAEVQGQQQARCCMANHRRCRYPPTTVALELHTAATEAATMHMPYLVDAHRQLQQGTQTPPNKLRLLPRAPAAAAWPQAMPRMDHSTPCCIASPRPRAPEAAAWPQIPRLAAC